MKRNKSIILLVAAVLTTGTIAAQAQCCSTAEQTKSKAKKAQTTCPVMGGKIDKAQYADVEGKRIYVCCPACVAKVKANPDKYIKKLEAEGVAIAKTPKKGEAKKSSGHSGHDHSSEHPQ